MSTALRLSNEYNKTDENSYQEELQVLFSLGRYKIFIDVMVGGELVFSVAGYLKLT